MRLVVLSGNFGLNFSGGCIATVKFLETLQNAFEEVIILTQKIGTHQLNKVQFITYNQLDEIPELLVQYNSSDTIGYGDFYIAEYFVEVNIPFYFTYHDNFPEIAEHHLFDPIFARERMACYQKIFKNAAHVFSVSKAKMPYINFSTEKVSLIRNGAFQPIEKKQVLVPLKDESLKILMAGNVDARKYQKAIELFNLLKEEKSLNIQIDIYGLLNDKSLAEKIAAFTFVQLKGYAPSIPFKKYHLYLNTSLAENLSIAVVDAIANLTPVITFDVGGLKEVLNSNNGFAIPAFQVETMKAKLLNINYQHFAGNFDTTTIKHFDWKKGAEQMLEIMLPQHSEI